MISKRNTNKNPLRITFVFLLVTGALALLSSILYESPTLAFIGLGLTFWGALFLFLGPARQIETNLLCNAAAPTYSTIDRIIKDFKYTGKAFYIPPYPKGVYIPEHLKSLKEAVVYVSAEENTDLPSNEEIAQGKFLLENPKGILIPPPGLGILTDIEQKSNIDFTNMNIIQLCEIVPQIILEKYAIAKEIEMTIEESEITIKIKGSAYKKLYAKEANLISIPLLGCPLASAVACALTKSSNKVVKITKHEVSPNDLAIQVTYQIMQDSSQQNPSALT